MGAAKRQTSKTTITEYEEQEMSIRVLEVLPEMLQVRANLDKDWSLQYSRDYAAGDAFPPILVYRLPDERLVVTDGFHRLDACMAIGKKTIRAQVREGTIHEALLAAIEANTAAFHRGRPFGENDRRHAAEMMFADPECWLWSDSWIAEISGLAKSTINALRSDYAANKGMDLPSKVMRKNGLWQRRCNRRSAPGKPAISPTDRGLFRSTVGGRDVYGKTIEAVEAKLKSSGMRLSESRVSLNPSALRAWILRAGIPVESCCVNFGPRNVFSGSVLKSAIIVTAEISGINSVRLAIGDLCLLRRYLERPSDRLIVVCYPEDFPVALLDLARQDGIEFLTPEDLVESLKGEATSLGDQMIEGMKAFNDALDEGDESLPT